LAKQRQYSDKKYVNPTLAISEMHWNALKCIGMHWNAQKCIGMHRNAVECIGMHRNALECTEMHWNAFYTGGLWS